MTAERKIQRFSLSWRIQHFFVNGECDTFNNNRVCVKIS